MKHFTRVLWLATLNIPLLVAAAELPSRRYQLALDPAAQSVQTPPLNAEKALAEDALADKGAPLRYAIMHKAAVNLADRSKFAVGRWSDVDADTRLWRTRIDAPGAVSIDLALKPFHLPDGAEVWLSDAAGQRVRGPYTAADNPKSGEFWTPYVPGDVAYLEVLVPKRAHDELQLGILSVQQAYRSIESGDSPFAKSGSCNVDTVCPEGNNYRDQINAVARYSVSGGLCTGQLVNNAAQDNKRYFMTANHCVSSQSDANSVVAYWKYENPTCRTPGSSESGTPISAAGNSISQTGGAVLRATYAVADTTLLELNTTVPTAANAFWLGWDRTENPVASGVSIHHPQGDEKRISFENQALVISDNTPSGVPGDKHWQISDWDLGTTEPGSSGSVLMNPQKRLIGVLSGGGAACGNNQPDYYGRLSVAWEGGGSAASRVKDWLDPGNSGATAIDGKATCAKPTLALSLEANARAGTAALMSVQIAGGTGPYAVEWDIDGDGAIDRRTAGVASTTSIQPVYPNKRSTTVSVNVIDATGCSAVASQVYSLRGPQLAATANGDASQSCGDGDSNIEPGEIWNVPVRISNAGDDVIGDGFAVFTGGTAVGAGGGSSTGASDNFGYRALASATSASCRYQPVDMSGASALTPVIGPHVTNAPASDEGYVAGLSVGGASPFRFYDRDITSLMMSTNGYLSTNAADGGDDYTAACGVDDHADVTDGRVQVLHDDLVIQSGGSLKHQHFGTCPRASDAGSASQGCTVFEWRNMGRYASGGSATGNAVFQTILYDQSYEIVHQYVTADPTSGSNASIGLQSPDESIRFDYQCDAPNAAPSGTALCFFHPTALPATLAEGEVHVVSTANALGDLAAAGSANVTVKAYVDPAAQCGSRAVVSYLGGVGDYAYSFAPTKVLDVAMPNSGNCQVATQCAAQVQSVGALPQPGGLYLNFNRSGNGQNLFNYGNILSSAWFTGKADRTPVWYIVNGEWNPGLAQAPASILKVTRTSSAPFTTAVATVGSAQFTRGDDDSVYINTWEFNGVWAADKLSRAFSPTAVPNPNHSGGWFNSGQSGWGVVIDEHIVSNQASTGFLGYIFDNANEPRWALGEAVGSSGLMLMNTYLVHCPSCPVFEDFGSLPLPAGNITRSYQSQTTGTLDTAIVFPAPLSGSWTRNALPIQMITPPPSSP